MSIFDNELRSEYKKVMAGLDAVLRFGKDGDEMIFAPDGRRMGEERLSENAKRILAFERSRRTERRCSYEIYVYRDGTTGAGII